MCQREIHRYRMAILLCGILKQNGMVIIYRDKRDKGQEDQFIVGSLSQRVEECS